MRTAKELNRRKRRSSPIANAFLIVALCLLLVLGGSFFNRTFGRMAMAISSPFFRIGNSFTTTIRNASSSLRFKQSLLSENDKLKQRLVALEAALSDHQALEADNQALRQEIGLTRGLPGVTVAELLSHPWNSPFDIVLAALPENNQVVVGNKVIFNKNVLAGEVISKTNKVVKIKLVSAPDSQVPVLIGATNIPAMAQGRGNGNLMVELPRNLEIAVDEVALSADSDFPLSIGKVGAVEKDADESLQTIFIKTPINLSLVRYLEIYAD